MTVAILVGDVFACLAELPDESIDCVVTSPPYWGLRDYGVDGQIGLEPTLGEHLDVMVRVFREVRRVLKRSGTLWLNYGDCYATSPNGRSAADQKAAGTDDRTFRDKPFSTIGPIYDPHGGAKGGGRRGDNKGNSGGESSGRIVSGGHLKPKDLCMIPNRLAIALQEDGWWVRSEIIWHKPNPMPESAKDRPTTSHEKVFLLTKAERYFYNADAIREGFETGEDANTFRGGAYVKGARGNSDMGRRAVVGNRKRGVPPRHEVYASSDQSGLDLVGRGMGRNARNVWTIATKPFAAAHFATFPPELAERCLQAGCPKGGTVLDPFGGAGTVGLVGDGLGLSVTLIELNPEYAEIARRRITAAQGPMFASVERSEIA